ncbi:hypothetical protein F443_14631 [Phytophthora nicotianae P1569]|uniref:Uncharacterized protein n=1 Tax=Phytophthora nicotianae P1569 TaxID=1317065 RepID=V9ELJ1_PHYNI|nr:hypothetical protein F443_14631 [Phytophthora nicotianae P1569]
MSSLRIVAGLCMALLALAWMGGDAATTSCAALVSIGDQAVGISAIEDASCKNGGVGCFSNGICRYCQKSAFPQSNHLVKCSSVASSTPTIAPPSSAAASIPSITTECTSIMTRSSLTGISFVTDRACNVAHPAAVGCVAHTNCRLCRATKNEGNQFLINCAVLQKANERPVRRLSTDDNTEGPTPKNFTAIALGCVGGMALVVAIIGLAHSKFCRRDNTPTNCAVDEDGLAIDNVADLKEKDSKIIS